MRREKERGGGLVGQGEHEVEGEDRGQIFEAGERTLDVVAKDLSVALSAALAESLASLSASRHCWLLVVKLPAPRALASRACFLFSCPFAIF